MEVLLTGRLKSISSSLIDKIAGSNRIILASDDINPEIVGQNCKCFSKAPLSSNFRKLFATYSFGVVVYFCGRPDECGGYFSDLAELEAVLRTCSDFDVQKVIFVSSTYIYEGVLNPDESTKLSPDNSVSVLIQSCEKLCEAYRNNNGMEILILRVPCLFGMHESESLIGKLAKQIALKNFAQIDGMPSQKADFLSQDDLGVLMLRIIQDWPDRDIESINVSGAKQMKLSELEACLKNIIHTTRLSFSDKHALIYPPVQSNVARELYGWTPVISIEDDFGNIIKNIKSVRQSRAYRIRQSITGFFTKRSNALKILELSLGYILMEFLNNVTSTTAQFSFVDFRLLYVVLLGTVHGITTGIAAAVLASVSLTIGFFNDGIDWTVLVYNIENWLAYTVYFITGAICGYTKDKHRNDYTTLKDEWVELERRYKFLNEVYNSSLQNKKQFKKQIITYRDSFGRIFEITKKLDNTVPEAVFKEALLALENILENQTIRIYSIQKGSRFGRLRVCSKKIIESAPKSLDLDKYEHFAKNLKKNEVWKNIDLIPGYPDYVFPIYSDNTLALLVIVNKVTHEQMAVYFENLLKIVCNLIEVALLRARQYNEKFVDEFYLPGTRILKRDAFKDVLRVKAQMEEVAISEYALISVFATPDTIVEVGQKLQKYLRESDIVGEGDNNNLYIILSQASEKDVPYILSRLEKAGLAFKQIQD